MKIRSIAAEEKACRKAFAGSKVGDLVNFCHHEVQLEILESPPESRIEFVTYHKSSVEVARRLRLFRPLKTDAKLRKDPKWIALVGEVTTWFGKLAELNKSMRFGLHVIGERYMVRNKLDDAVREAGNYYRKHFTRIFGSQWRGNIFRTFSIRSKP